MAPIHDYKDKLFTSSLFHWMPKEGLDYFEGCFDLEVEEILLSETRMTENRIGYLLSGNAILESEAYSLQSFLKDIYLAFPFLPKQVSAMKLKVLPSAPFPIVLYFGWTMKNQDLYAMAAAGFMPDSFWK